MSAGASRSRARACSDPSFSINYVNTSYSNKGAVKDDEPSVKPEPVAPDPAYARVHAVYQDEIGPALGRQRKRRIPKGSALGRLLVARIGEHDAEAVETVLRWWAFSGHSRAEFLRDKGLGLKTVLRSSNFAEYLEMADGGEPPRPPLPGEYFPSEPEPDDAPRPNRAPDPEFF